VIVLVVDQMRADYLERFDAQFGAGLRWLLDNGVVFEEAHHDHAVTATAPGHATIATGTLPSRHGIVGNDYFDRARQLVVYSVADPDAPLLGLPDDAGRSPRNMLRGALGDWLKAASPDSRVFAVAIKDRAAITMGGQRPDGVYWYHYRTGRFVTSAYYRPNYPDWVEEFNRSGLAAQYNGINWDLVAPESLYVESRGEPLGAEIGVMGSSFPHHLGGSGQDPDGRYFEHLPWTPFGDELTLAFAARLIEREGLGRDQHPDLLFIGLSSADFIGHAYGPYSREVQDYYLRLDLLLSALMRIMETSSGGRLVLALTADHGVMALPEELARRGYDTGRIKPARLLARARSAVAWARERGVIAEEPKLRFSEGIAFSFEGSPTDPAGLAQLRRLVAEELRAGGELAAAWTYDEMRSGSGDGELYEMFRHSFRSDRAPDVFVAPKRNFLLIETDEGTTHGSPYDYDTHVPLIFAGMGIEAGWRDSRVRTVDIAPTIASILGIDAPDDLDGRPLDLTGRHGTSR
jgi:predicted AlkP superfamily pyrophosphatase or phosphodiesterase